MKHIYVHYLLLVDSIKLMKGAWMSKMIYQKLMIMGSHVTRVTPREHQCFRQNAPLRESRVAFREGPQRNRERANLALYFYKDACRLNPGIINSHPKVQNCTWYGRKWTNNYLKCN